MVAAKLAHFRPVQVGLMAEGRVEIVSGIRASEPVVVLGQNRLRDGQPVELMGGDRGRRDDNGSGSGAADGASGKGRPTPARGQGAAGADSRQKVGGGR